MFTRKLIRCVNVYSMKKRMRLQTAVVCFGAYLHWMQRNLNASLTLAWLQQLLLYGIHIYPTLGQKSVLCTQLMQQFSLVDRKCLTAPFSFFFEESCLQWIYWQSMYISINIPTHKGDKHWINALRVEEWDACHSGPLPGTIPIFTWLFLIFDCNSASMELSSSLAGMLYGAALHYNTHFHHLFCSFGCHMDTLTLTSSLFFIHIKGNA